MEFSIVISAFHEEKQTESYVHAATDFLNKYDLKGEIIVISNGNADHLTAVAERINQSVPIAVKVIPLEGNGNGTHRMSEPETETERPLVLAETRVASEGNGNGNGTSSGMDFDFQTNFVSNRRYISPRPQQRIMTVVGTVLRRFFNQVGVF